MNNDFDDLNEDELEPVKSRTQIKKEMEALQKLGKRLIDLKPDQLKEVPISEELHKAIQDYAKMPHREAKRRHMQFIGKLMRSEDGDAIQAVIDRYDSSSQAFAQELHQLEVWRTRLIEEGNKALTEFVEAHPSSDIQQLRQLIRNAQKDAKNQKNTGASKKLFQFIRSVRTLD